VVKLGKHAKTRQGRAHERRDALEALDARTWVDVAEERVQHRGAANGSVASLLHLPQAPHAYTILVDARVQTAGCVASRLHAVADLDVQDDEVALVIALAGADGQDFALVGLLGSVVGDHDAGGGLGFVLETLHDHAVVQRAQLHRISLSLGNEQALRKSVPAYKRMADAGT
jgi:hypothetical protein